MKKTLIIISIFVALLALGIGVYFAWNKSKQILTPPTVEIPIGSQNQNQGQNAPIEQLAGKLKSVGNEKISSYWIYQSASSSEIYYFNDEGLLFKMKSGGDEKVLEEAIGGIKNLVSDKDGKSVAMESNGDLVILTIGTSGIIKESIKDVVSASFSPDSDKMAYFTGSGDLNIRDYSSKLKSPKTSKIINLNFEDAVIQWISGNKIILSSRPSAFYFNESWLLDLNKKTVVPFIQARGLSFNWSSDGKTAVKFNVDASFGQFLSLIDLSGLTLANFDFSSLPEKCSIGTKKIYCAISQSNNSSGRLILPDDWLKRKVYFNDWIYEIDSETQDISLVYPGNETAIDAYDLKIAGNHAFFINRYDGKLYDLELF